MNRKTQAGNICRPVLCQEKCVSSFVGFLQVYICFVIIRLLIYSVFFICSDICWADHEIARTVTRRYKSLSTAVSLGNAPVFVTFLKLQFIASIALLTYITCLTAWPWSHNCSICAELRFHALTAPECFQLLAEHFKRRIQVYCSVYLFQALRTWFVFLCRNVFDRILYQV